MACNSCAEWLAEKKDSYQRLISTIERNDEVSEGFVCFFASDHAAPPRAASLLPCRFPPWLSMHRCLNISAVCPTHFPKNSGTR